MKKLLYLLLLIIPFLLTDKVYASESKIYDYNASVMIDIEKSVVTVDERFSTKDIDSSIKYHRDLSGIKIIESDIKNPVNFYLEPNKEYHTSYKYNCEDEKCIYKPAQIYYLTNGDNGYMELVPYETPAITIISNDEKELPEYKIKQIKNKNYVVNNKNGVMTITFTGNDINAFKITFYKPVVEEEDDDNHTYSEIYTDDEVEKIDEECETFFITICIYFDIALGIIILYLHFKKENMLKENNRIYDSSKTRLLKSWPDIVTARRKKIMGIVILIFALVLAAIIIAVTLTVYMIKYPGLYSNPMSMSMFYFIAFIHVGLLSIPLYITSGKIIEIKIKNLICKNEIHIIDDYKVTEESKIIQGKEMVNYTLYCDYQMGDNTYHLNSRNRLTDKYVEYYRVHDAKVFLIFIDNNDYYLDYIINY